MQSSRHAEFREEALPFVIYNTEKRSKEIYIPISSKFNFHLFVVFEVNEEAADFLKQLSGPLGIISVAGMYRTGKSYLLNRMLLNRSGGFGVGPTINPCTKVKISFSNRKIYSLKILGSLDLGQAYTGFYS